MDEDEGFDERTKALLLQVTPEKGSDIERILADVTLFEDDRTEEICFEASANWKIVRVPRRCQLRLWAQCYAYFCDFAAFAARWQGLSPQTRFNLSDSDLKNAGAMLEWSKNAELRVISKLRAGMPIELESMPKEMPRPFEGQTPQFIRSTAEQLFQTAIAFIIHHELAHIRLGHRGPEGDVPIEEEFEADKEAAQFIGSGCELSEHGYLMRYLGISMALLWFTTIDFYEKYKKRRHPPSWERLYRALEPAVKSDLDPIWGFVVLALLLHFRRVGLSIDSMQDFAPTKDTVRSMLNILETHNKTLA